MPRAYKCCSVLLPLLTDGNLCILVLYFTEIDLKKASKLFANKFSCGSSVTGDDEIVIQGDVSYDIIELIQNTWPEVS